MVLFGRRTEKDFLTVTDFLAPLCAVGLGCGRLGNFINVELPGRITESGLGLVFPCRAVTDLNPMCWRVGEVARHPSSLYQAFTEGVLLFCLLWWLALTPKPKGTLSGAFLVAYGSFRFLTEFSRSPDAHLGFILFEFLSMGQLPLPMIVAGVWLLRWSQAAGLRRRRSDRPPKPRLLIFGFAQQERFSMQQYLDLMRHVRENGTYKSDRTGTGTYSVWTPDAF